MIIISPIEWGLLLQKVSGEAVLARRLGFKVLIVYFWLICFESSSKLNALTTGTSIFKACIKYSPSSQNLDCTSNRWITFRRWQKLPEQQHEIHQHFKEGLHTICLPDCCCSRSFLNLVTEQCLMGNLMTTLLLM